MLFRVLGSLEVVGSDGSLVPIPGTMNRQLLVALLTARGDAVRQADLVDELWGEDPPEEVSALLRSKVSVLRRSLRAGGAAPDLLEASRGGYRLKLQPGSTDIDEFEACLARADDVTGQHRVKLLREALGLWRGQEAFADLSRGGPSQVAAAGLEERRLAAHEDLLSSLLDLGRSGEVVGEITALVAAHPLRERLRSLQMQALYQEGRQADALAAYRQVAKELAEELGIDPGPELVAIHEAILRQSPELFSDAVPTPRSGDPTSSDTEVAALPEALTNLVGREQELKRVDQALSNSRLVMLLGPGGVGKTRVAVEAARATRTKSSREVWFVDFSALRVAGREEADEQVAVVSHTIARALGVMEEAAQPGNPVEQLGSALVGSTAILVLDTIEHVIDGVRPVVETLLRAVPGLRVLVTGREPLRVAGEVVLDVPPLASPPPDADVTSAHGWPALELLEDRARDSFPEFIVDADNASAVAAVCRGVDGLPLGLELVAPRLRVLSPEDIAERLGDLMQRPGANDTVRSMTTSALGSQLPERQRTLDAVIGWSWELLTPAEQGALLRLGIAEGSWSLKAAEAVLGDLVSPQEAADLVVTLVDRSLLAVIQTRDGMRYQLSASVYRFCAARRTPDVDRAARDAHLADLIDRLNQLDEDLRGPRQVRALATLDLEMPHLDRALGHAVEMGLGTSALSLAVASIWHSSLRGQLADAGQRLGAALGAGEAEQQGSTMRRTARTWLAALQSMTGQEPDLTDLALSKSAIEGATSSDARALMRARGLLAVMLADGHIEFDLNEQCLAESRAHNYRWGEAAALSTRAWNALYSGDLGTVVQDADVSRALFSEEGDEWGVLHASDPLAAAARVRGDIEVARTLAEDSLERARRLGLWPKVTSALCELGWLELDHGNPSTATELHTEAVRLAARQGAAALQQLAEIGLAVGERRRGDIPRAAVRLERWREWNRHRQWPAGEARVLLELGRLEEARGQTEAAERNFAEARRLAAECADGPVEAASLEGLAWASFARADRSEARRRLADAAQLRLEHQVSATPEEQRRVDDLEHRLT